jgi:hypothetical protein
VSPIVEVDEAVSLAHGHAWIPLASLIINVLLRLSKTDAAVDWFPVSIRPRVRPVAALVLGVASGVLAGLVGGSWFSAIVGGIVAGMMAITTHDVVVESIRKGRDIFVPKRPEPAPDLGPLP